MASSVRDAVRFVDIAFRGSANDPTVRCRATPPPIDSIVFVDFPGVTVGDASVSHDGPLGTLPAARADQGFQIDGGVVNGNTWASANATLEFIAGVILDENLDRDLVRE